MSPQPANIRILDLFENSLARYAHKVALEAPDRSLTYAELNARAENFALHLAELGLPRGSVIGIYMDGSAEYVVAVLGALKADMVFMPLNTVFPGQRLLSILEKTLPRLLITDLGHETDLRTKTGTSQPSSVSEGLVMLPETDWEGASARASGNIGQGAVPGTAESDNSPAHACYIITTSGSTGQPKAILGSQAGLAHFIRWEIDEFGFDQDVRVSLFSPVTFDVSLRDIFVPLAAGGTLCIPGDETVQHPLELLGWMRRQELTAAHMVPTLFRMLTRAVVDAGGPGQVLPCLRYVFLAGEPVYRGDILGWRRAAGSSTKLVNLYGPSETTLAKLFHRIDEDHGQDNEMVPIGVPIPDTEVLIIKDGKACPAGEPGEIHIRTPFMSLGYYNDPELTRENFVQNPLNPDRADVVYRTGDQGLLGPDGVVRFLGRLDGQVKFYGRRIELGEIEALLRQHQDVLQAAAAVRTDAAGNARLTAYMVPRGGRKPAVESLRAFLRDRLPEYMLPQVFVNLEALPLTHSGKVDRQALPGLERRRPEMQSPFTPPATEQERVLCEVWGQVLGLDRVGTKDGFFDLGGTSVLSIRLVDGIKRVMGVDLPVVKVFQYPDVSSLAAYIQGMNHASDRSAGLEARAGRRRTAMAARRR